MPTNVMPTNKSLLSIVTMSVALTIVGCASPRIAAAEPPPAALRQEEATHPRLFHALQAMRDALRELEAAPDNFGGNKAAAIRDTRLAIHSIKRALYFRLNMDDATIDLLS